MIIPIIGALFIFVIPGLLITLIFFSEIKLLEKIVLTFILSTSFVVILGVLLGFNEFTYNLTGGITKTNLWIYYLVINVSMLGYYIYAKNINKKSKK